MYYYYTDLSAVEAAVIENCGNHTYQCLGEQVSLQCNTTNAFLEWYIRRYQSEFELEFNVFDNNGVMRTAGNFTATLIDKFGRSLESDLTFVARNNTEIMCFDGVSGHTATCTLLLAGLPNMPLNVQMQESHTELSGSVVVNITWNPPKYTDGREIAVDHYEVIVIPPPDAGVCTSGSCNITETTITLYRLQCQNYNVTIQPINCAGRGLPYTWLLTSGMSKLPRYTLFNLVFDLVVIICVAECILLYSCS